MDDKVWQIWRTARLETLRELHVLAKAGVPMTPEALKEMALECERATETFLDLNETILPNDANVYPSDDPKHPEWHSVHVDIWDARERG